MTNKFNFSNRLINTMNERGIKQRELALAVGVTEVSMSRYVHGLRIPRMAVLRKISEELHVTTDYLIGKDDYIHDPETALWNVIKLSFEYSDEWTIKEKKRIIDVLFKDEKQMTNIE